MKRDDLNLDHYRFAVRPTAADEGSAEAASGQFRLRLPKTMHARLTRRAAQEGVSLNTLAATLIAEGLGKRRAG